jgi:hypothetical protein
MNEYLISIKAYLYDRAVSPFFGAFVFSWISWNYKFLMIVFSDINVHEKINYISNNIYPYFNEWLRVGVVLPFISAMAFVFLYPVIAIPTFLYARKAQKILHDLKQKIDGEKLLSKNESRELKKILFSHQIQFQEEIDKKDNEIELLKKMLALHNLNISEDKDIQLSEAQLFMLRYIVTNAPVLEEQILGLYASNKDVHAIFDLTQLKQFGFVIVKKGSLKNHALLEPTDNGLLYLRRVQGDDSKDVLDSHWAREVVSYENA